MSLLGNLQSPNPPPNGLTVVICRKLKHSLRYYSQDKSINQKKNVADITNPQLSMKQSCKDIKSETCHNFLCKMVFAWGGGERTELNFMISASLSSTWIKLSKILRQRDSTVDMELALYVAKWSMVPSILYGQEWFWEQRQFYNSIIRCSP